MIHIKVKAMNDMAPAYARRGRQQIIFKSEEILLGLINPSIITYDTESEHSIHKIHITY